MTTPALNRNLRVCYTVSELCEIGAAATFVLSFAFPRGRWVGAMFGFLLFLCSVGLQVYALTLESRTAADSPSSGVRGGTGQDDRAALENHDPTAEVPA